MKCLKALRTTKEVEAGEIIRVDNKTAHNMVGSMWQYISKSEWKSATRKPKEESEKKNNLKQMNGIETTEPFVKTRKKSK